MTNSQLWETHRDCFWTEYIITVHDPEGWSLSYWGGGGGGGKFWLMFLNSPYSQLHGISVTNIFQIRPFFPRWTKLYIFTRSLICFYSLPIFLIFHNYYISIHSPWDMDPCAGLHILAHGSIPLPYLPNLCAVLRPAPLASYCFPFLSFPLPSPCIGLSLDLTRAAGDHHRKSQDKFLSEKAFTVRIRSVRISEH